MKRFNIANFWQLSAGEALLPIITAGYEQFEIHAKWSELVNFFLYILSLTFEAINSCQSDVVFVSSSLFSPSPPSTVSLCCDCTIGIAYVYQFVVSLQCLQFLDAANSLYTSDSV